MHDNDCSCGMCKGDPDKTHAIDFSGYDDLIDSIAKQMHEGKLKPEQLNQKLIQKTYENLNEAASSGYGENWVKFDKKGTAPRELKKNIWAFSGSKSYAQLVAINQILIDKDGKLRNFSEVKLLAAIVGHQFNENYLQAEYQTARTGAQMAEKWERLQETKDLFPNLKYRTVGDDRVRREHARLDGIIKPIDDDFWNRYYPPLDWRCRCDVVATAEDSTEEDDQELPVPQFKGNVGKDKEVFSKNGSFFKLAATSSNATRNIEISKLSAPYEEAFKAKNGKRLTVNIQADENDLADNIAVGKVIVEQTNQNLAIRPHLDSWIVKGHKNPEYLIDGNQLADRKTPESTNYSNVLSKANKQGCEVVVLDLSANGDTVDNAMVKINNILRLTNVHPNIKEVMIVSADKKTVKVYQRKKQP